ncbi:unnamed protein product [Allacma fusca]|uniref:F-box domain-containing protein n=1 Tax=Allacma fusca TaxID=39272 RepID=A0A8J2NVE5_9HEXA|nr:unnamed protein product [Allacma fusca]
MDGYINQYEIRRYINGFKRRSLQSVTEKTKQKAVPTSIVNQSGILMHIWEIPQVLESLFNQVHATDLKKFRLVNKRWNQAACIQLRKLTFVNLALPSQVKLQNFWEVFQQSQLTKFSSPFKRYVVSIQVIIQSEIISNILSHPSAEMISLSYSTDQNITYYSKHFINLHNILHTHGKTLKIFNYTFSNFDKNIMDEGWYSSELGLAELHLPALSEFSFFIWNYSSATWKQKSFSHFLQGIILGSPNLRKFCTNADDPKLLYYLLSGCSTIQDLYLQKISNPVLETLLQTELPNLKSLGLIPNKRVPNLDSELFVDVLKKIALGIEELAISRLSSLTWDATFPILPALKNILLHDSSSNLKILSPERFPSLRSVYLAGFKISSIKTAEERHEYFSTDPHVGVENFGLKCSRSCDDRDEASKIKMEQDLVFLMAFVCRQFPCVVSLHLSMSKFLNGVVRSVIRFFPQIKFLKLELTGDASFPEDIFTGRDHRMQCPSEELRKKPCLADLFCLKVLVLSRVVEDASTATDSLTHNAIKYGIAAIPALEVFQLDWYDSMNFKIIKENLGHLSQVILVKPESSPVYAKFEELQKEMANFKLSCKANNGGDEYHKIDTLNFKNYF